MSHVARLAGHAGTPSDEVVSDLDIARLLETCAPLGFRRARRFLDDEAAWDVVQDVFESIARSPAAIRAAERPMAYI